MTDSPPPPPMLPVTEAELHAYADRQLTAERLAEIADWLARRPEEAARVQAWDDQRRELRALFDPVLDEAVPASLRDVARRRVPWSIAPAAAAAVLALAAGGAGWALRGAHDETTIALARAAEARAGSAFAARAALAYAVYAPEVRHPVEVDAAHEDHLVAWLSKRLGAAVRAPRLQPLGYALEGGRLLPGDHGPVAQFMYRDAAGHRLTLYVSHDGLPGAAAGASTAPAVSDARAATPDTAFRFMREGEVNVFWWVDGPFRYAISAPTDRATLERVAEEVWRQLAGAGA